MTDRLIRCVVFILVCVVPLASTPARADEADLLLRLEEQQKIIYSQSQRIDRLEQTLDKVIETQTCRLCGFEKPRRTFFSIT